MKSPGSILRLPVLMVLLLAMHAACSGGGAGKTDAAEDEDATTGEPPLPDGFITDGTEDSESILGEPPLGDAVPDIEPDDEACDPPDTVNVDGRCVPSCAFTGGNTCTTDPSECGDAELLESYDCDVCCYVEPVVPPACLEVPEPEPAEGCVFPAEIVIYGQEAWNRLGDAFSAHLSPCANYWISIPPLTSDKKQLRPDEAARMHARGPRLHAMAEFHWASWSSFHADTGTSWLEIGHLFRQRMEDAGYCVESGDTWAVNEAPSAVRNDTDQRAAFAELVQGLYQGEAGMTPAKGAVFVWGMGHATVNFSVYKPSLKAWLQDASFWAQVNLYVRWWGQEVYTDPYAVCVGTAAVDTRADYVNDFAMHVPRLAAAAPDSAGANTAQSYFSRAFVPVMNGVWYAERSRGYGDTTIPLAQMRHHITLQVLAARTWAEGHTYPDGRIGFAFASYHEPTEWDTLASTLAVSILGAYSDDASGPEGACMEGGVERWCNCNVPGSTFNDGWQTFRIW